MLVGLVEFVSAGIRWYERQLTQGIPDSNSHDGNGKSERRASRHKIKVSQTSDRRDEKYKEDHVSFA